MTYRPNICYPHVKASVTSVSVGRLVRLRAELKEASNFCGQLEEGQSAEPEGLSDRMGTRDRGIVGAKGKGL